MPGDRVGPPQMLEPSFTLPLDSLAKQAGNYPVESAAPMVGSGQEGTILEP